MSRHAQHLPDPSNPGGDRHGTSATSPVGVGGTPMTRGLSLRTRFVLAALACLLPLLGVAVFILVQSVENTRSQVVETERTLTNLVTQGLNETLNNNATILTTLANDEAIRSFDQASAQTALSQTLKTSPGFVGFFLVDSNKQVISSTEAAPVTDIAAYQSAVERALTGNETAVSNPFSIADDKDAIAIAVPVTDKTSGVVGVVGGLLSVDRLKRTFVPYAGDNTVISILSQEQIVASSVATSEGEALPSQLAEPLALALSGAVGTYTFDNSSGAHRLATYAPVGFAGAPWAVFVSQPSPRTYGPTKALLQQSLIALAAACLLTLGLALFFGEVTARPLRRLTAQAGAMAQGDFTQRIDPTGGGEVRSLSAAFRDMEDRLAQQVDDLEAAREERKQQADELRELHRRTVRLQEDERRRIAGEIHDAVSPLITGALYQARALRMSNGATPPEVRDEGLDAVTDLLGRAGDELHGVIFDLRPPDLDDLGVVPAIERYIQTIQRTGLAVRLELNGDPPMLTPEIRLGIYRIVQEALHNVVRHANADEATVRLESSPERLRVVVRDNGSGFEADRPQGPTSLGILSMRERAAAIGASFEIASRPGGGTVVVIERADPDAVTPEPGALTAARDGSTLSPSPDGPDADAAPAAAVPEPVGQPGLAQQAAPVGG